ncbi:GNAT family N-acetyltransferase [Nguyenibacter vanlangensis]|uniref:GNAT family N-acetyltransferase n=1 Tax=Nguyenibacter vanlangensis TaxID=1216886 RepID=A0ABZ3D2Z6_9PROT
MNGTTFFRTAVTADIDRIRTLVRASYAKWVPLIGREPWPMTADYARAVREHRIDLLLRGEDLAALIEMIPRDDHLLIENVAVSPAFQRQGLGRTLMAHAEHVASTLGHNVIRLYTNQLFAENIAFYHRLGYTIDAEEQWHSGVIVHMHKSIAPSGLA